MVWYVNIQLNTSLLPEASCKFTVSTQMEEPEIPAFVWHLIKIYKACKSDHLI